MLPTCEVRPDLHACGLFDLAYTICGSGTVAESAVLDAFQAACADSSSTDPAKRVSQELSRLVFLACRAAEEVIPAESRGGDTRHALLGLTLYGEHTYAEAARLLGLEPRGGGGAATDDPGRCCGDLRASCSVISEAGAAARAVGA